MKLKFLAILFSALLAAPAGYGMVQPMSIPVFQPVFPEFESPKDLARWLKKNIRFEEDRFLFGKEDYWQSPEEFYNRRSGDCEDYALFAQHALKKKGIESYVVSLYGKNGYAHTVLVYQDSEGYHVLNQDKLKRYGALTIEDALSKFYSRWTWAGIAETRNNRGWLIFSLENS